MMKLLIATALTAVVCAANANAQNYEGQSQSIIKEVSLTTPFKERTEPKPTIQIGSTIGIARLDKGRLIYAPMAELRDWASLDNHSGATFAPVSPVAFHNNFPNAAVNKRNSDNKLDEIRITASDLRMDYVLIYGMGSDAQWGSFGGKAMAETGFIYEQNEISPRGAVKAVLVNTYTGQVYGTVTSDEIEFNINDLTGKFNTLINTLTAEHLPKQA